MKNRRTLLDEFISERFCDVPQELRTDKFRKLVSTSFSFQVFRLCFFEREFRQEVVKMIEKIFNK